MKRLLAAQGDCYPQSTVVDLMRLKNLKTRQLLIDGGIRDCLAELPFEDESEPVIFFLAPWKALEGTLHWTC
jgi:hypothetical protein